MIWEGCPLPIFKPLGLHLNQGVSSSVMHQPTDPKERQNCECAERGRDRERPGRADIGHGKRQSERCGRRDDQPRGHDVALKPAELHARSNTQERQVKCLLKAGKTKGQVYRRQE